MDILNWVYLKTSELIRTKANNADTDLIAVGAIVVGGGNNVVPVFSDGNDWLIG